MSAHLHEAQQLLQHRLQLWLRACGEDVGAQHGLVVLQPLQDPLQAVLGVGGGGCEDAGLLSTSPKRPPGNLWTPTAPRPPSLSWRPDPQVTLTSPSASLGCFRDAPRNISSITAPPPPSPSTPLVLLGPPAPLRPPRTLQTSQCTPEHPRTPQDPPGFGYKDTPAAPPPPPSPPGTVLFVSSVEGSQASLQRMRGAQSPSESSSPPRRTAS